MEEIALSFDAAALPPAAAMRAVDELGAIRRLVDGMLASAAKRVVEANASARNCATVVARNLGVRPGEVRAAAKTAGRLEKLPLTDAAVRSGTLSAAEAGLIAAAATVNASAERNCWRSRSRVSCR